MDGGREEMRNISAYWRMAWVGLLLVVGLVAAPTPTVSAAGRVALVVGNSTYAHIGRLPNPENDAAAMAAALGRRARDRCTRRPRRVPGWWLRQCLQIGGRDRKAAGRTSRTAGPAPASGGSGVTAVGTVAAIATCMAVTRGVLR